MRPTTLTRRSRARALAVILLSLFILVVASVSAISADTETRDIYDISSLRIIVSIVNAMFPTAADFGTADGQLDRSAEDLHDLSAKLAAVHGSLTSEFHIWLSPEAIPTKSSTSILKNDLNTVPTVTSFSGSSGHIVKEQITSFIGINVPVPSTTEYVVAEKSTLSDRWISSFARSQTEPRPFYGAKTTLQPFMYHPADLACRRGSDGMYIQIRAQAGVDMWLYEPSSRQDISDFRGNAYSPHIASEPPIACAFRIPRFEVEASVQNMLPLLLRKAFADVSALKTSKSPSIALQSARLKIDEDGISASSQTIMMEFKLNLLHPEMVVVDHPFKFALVDSTKGELLFQGSVFDLAQ